MTVHVTLRRTTAHTLAAGGLTSGFATAIAAALLAISVTTAVAAPTRSDEGAGPDPGDAGRLVDVVCFNLPHQWNVALNGPLPRCSRTVR
jgi:hypothetical protein